MDPKTPTALQLNKQFVEGAITATEIVEKHLQKIRKQDGELGAFLKVLDERALRSAQALDAKRRTGKRLGKLAGVPIAIKDNIHIKGELTTCGSLFLKNYRAPFDATAVSLLEQEDALFIGKTNLDEFAMGSSMENTAFHTTKNPHNLKCTPGGSSGGSAAAVAAGFCSIALGSDTGGSIRQPASFCGIVGFKPTYGTVSRYGLVAFGSSLDQIGPLTHTVQDTALVMEVLAKHCPKDSTSLEQKEHNYTSKLTSPIAGKTIGVPWAYLETLNEEGRVNFQEALKKLESLGLKTISVDLPILKYSIACYYILCTAEASTNLARFDGIRYGVRSKNAHTLEEIYTLSREEGFGDEVKNRILLGAYVLSAGHKEAYYKKAQKVRTLFVREFQAAFAKCDLIAMPTTPNPAFEMGFIHSLLEMYLQDTLTIPANLAGLPAISIPSGKSSNNMPLGLQLMGAQLQDSTVLTVAYAFETLMRGS